MGLTQGRQIETGGWSWGHEKSQEPGVHCVVDHPVPGGVRKSRVGSGKEKEPGDRSWT